MVNSGDINRVGNYHQQIVKNQDKQANAANNDFGRHISNAIQTNTAQSSPIRLSKHANMRLSARQINLSPEQLMRIEAGLSKAVGKGIRDSLVLVDDIALVVNVPSRVVVTALNQEQETLITNIDGAVIV